MVRRYVGRVTSMRSSNHKQIVTVHALLNLRQPPVKRLERPGVAFYVVAVTVQHVKIDKVNKNQSFACLFQCLDGLIKASAIVTSRQLLRGASMAKDRSDLANRHYFKTGGFHSVQHGGVRRFYRIVPAGFCSAKCARCPDKRPCNNPAYLIRAGQEPARRLAPSIELCHRNDFFVGRYLKHAVGRRVDYRPAGPDVFLTQFLYYLSSRGSFVSKNLPAYSLFESLDDMGGEPLRVRGKGLLDYQPAHFPMPGRRVFPIGSGRGPSE